MAFVIMKGYVFRDIYGCESGEENRRFRESYSLHVQGIKYAKPRNEYFFNSLLAIRITLDSIS
jgi:hypothetical protein